MNRVVPRIAGLLAASLVASLGFAGTAHLQEDAKKNEDAKHEQATQDASADSAAKPTAQAAKPAKSDEGVEDAVEKSSTDAASARRKSLIDEAVRALHETRTALDALENGDSEAALESLAVATGKLDLVVARQPDLALAPVDVRVVTHDLYATAESVENARDTAIEHLRNSRLQDARALIEGLRSDVTVEVFNVPLATYPDAIKAVTPLIDDGEVDLAIAELQSALNTLVVTQQILPLPVLRAQHELARAEELAAKEDRSDAQNDELSGHLDRARAQLEFAQVLGYGQEDDFEELYGQLDQIREKTEDGKSGTGFFERIKNALGSFGDDSDSELD